MDIFDPEDPFFTGMKTVAIDVRTLLTDEEIETITATMKDLARDMEQMLERLAEYYQRTPWHKMPVSFLMGMMQVSSSIDAAQRLMQKGVDLGEPPIMARPEILEALAGALAERITQDMKKADEEQE